MPNEKPKAIGNQPQPDSVGALGASEKPRECSDVT